MHVPGLLSFEISLSKRSQSERLTACQLVPNTDAAFIAAARRSVLAKLPKPRSAEFDDQRVVRTSSFGSTMTLVCGMVNARKRTGGPYGYVPFAYFAAWKGNDEFKPFSEVLASDLFNLDGAFGSSKFPTVCNPDVKAAVDQAHGDAANAAAGENASHLER